MNNTVLSQTPHQNIVATDLQIIYHACAGFIQSPVKLRTILLSIQNKKNVININGNVCKTVDAIFPFILHSIYEKMFFSPKNLKFSFDKAMLQNYLFLLYLVKYEILD